MRGCDLTDTLMSKYKYKDIILSDDTNNCQALVEKFEQAN